MKIELIPENHYKSVIETLNKNKIFSVLTVMELKSISKFFYRKFVNRDEYVYSMDEHGGSILYVIESGELKVYLRDGREKIISEGDIFGEVALINEELRTGSIVAIKDCKLLCIRKTDLLNEEKIKSTIILKIFKELAKLVTTYLRSNKVTSTLKLIENGESNQVEFKSTISINLYTNKKDQNITHAMLKSIAAFLNSKGGVLLLGVNDKGEIIGLKEEKFENDDKMLLHVTNLIRSNIDHSH
jgi:CRP-like cAMP-binding protein